MQATATISLTAVKQNFLSIRQILPPRTHLFCVVKADAYGHGAIPIAKEYAASRGVFFAVAQLEEGVALRESGITNHILILGHTSQSDVYTLLSYRLTPCIHSLAQAKELSAMTSHYQTILPYHLKIDSGMCRLGFGQVEEIEEVLSLPHLYIKGAYTHYACADMGMAGAGFTEQQHTRFLSCVNIIQKKINHSLVLHAGNSGALLDFPHLLAGGARVGILLYGIVPSRQVMREISISPVMTLSAPIVQLRDIPPDTPIGYGGAYVSTSPMRIATLPIGYADGIRREWADMSITFSLRGIPCPLVGRVCMDSCAIDVTGVQNPRIGETAILFGKGGMDVHTLTEKCHTIPYEILTGVGRRVKRVYLP